MINENIIYGKLFVNFDFIDKSTIIKPANRNQLKSRPIYKRILQFYSIEIVVIISPSSLLTCISNIFFLVHKWIFFIKCSISYQWIVNQKFLKNFYIFKQIYAVLIAYQVFYKFLNIFNQLLWAQLWIFQFLLHFLWCNILKID